jgi:hypothetical protein
MKSRSKTIGIGEDRRAPRKNLDEVSIVVAEARSTLFDPSRRRESGLNAGALNRNLQGFWPKDFTWAGAHEEYG